MSREKKCDKTLIRFFREILPGNGKWGVLGDAPFGLFFSGGEMGSLSSPLLKKG